LVYEQSGTGNLMVVPFDLAALEVTGDSVPVVQGVRLSPTSLDYAISDNGTLIYVPSTSTGGLDRTLVWVNREGQEEPLAAEPQGYGSPRISPDGSRVAITIEEPGGSDVWIYDLEREILTRLTFDPAADHHAVWTPDGRRIVFDSGRVETGHNLFWKAADGTGQVERLTTSPTTQSTHSLSPDGKRLVFGEIVAPRDLQVLSMEGERTSQPLFQSQFNETRGMISPDGRWIAYESDESGHQEIYVRPFPNVEEGKWQISSDGGTMPVWAPRGQELFYRNGEAMMMVGITTEPTFTAGSPVVLFTGRYTRGVIVNYDISPDGQRFLMIKAVGGSTGQINVVQNWFEELKRLVPTP
jgi:serine/threonine-protein kinase